MKDLVEREAIILLGRHFKVRVLPFDDGHKKRFLGITRDKEVLDEFSSSEESFTSEKIKFAVDIIRVLTVAGCAFG